MREEPSAPHSGVRPGHLRILALPKLHVRKETTIYVPEDNCAEVKREQLKPFTGPLSLTIPPFSLPPKCVDLHFPIFDERIGTLNIFHLLVCGVFQCKYF